MKFKTIAALTAALAAGVTTMGFDIMDGKMFAVPTPKPPVIDGKLDDWDLRGQEWIAVSRDIADRFSGDVSVMYDDDALYLGAVIRTGGGPMVNINKPGEKPWLGHELEFRCIADPTVPFPLRVPENDINHPAVKQWGPRFNTVTIWEETVTHTPHVQIVNGPPYNGKRNEIDPSDVKIKFGALTNPDRYVMEARIPWKRLGVESDKNPFKPGDRMTAFWTVMWPQGITQRAECLRIAPTGNFGWAWHHMKDWGRIEFVPAGKTFRRNPGMAEYLEATKATPVSDSFTVNVPADGGLLAVNIVDESGRILREIAGGEAHPAGPVKLYWDGFDWYGNPMKPGTYSWRAYWHKPLTAKFVGAPSTSARVPYETTDRTGNWGGNMGPPMSVAATADGRYWLWGSNEGGNSIVKTDYAGNVKWRNTPYVIEGGYGPHVAISANKKYCYVVSGWTTRFLTRYSAGNGLSAPFGDRRFIALDPDVKGPGHRDWNSPMPGQSGIAVSETELFVPDFYQNRVRVFDAETGAEKRQIQVDSPRAAALDEAGNLYVLASRFGGGGTVFRYANGKGNPGRALNLGRLFGGNLWGLAVRNGDVYLSDNGCTNRIYRFRDGKITGVFGREGGRPLSGRYVSDDLLQPAGLAIDAQGLLWVAESALPNVFKAIDPKTMTFKAELFGDVGYCPPAWPDSEDPFSVYTPEYYSSGVVRGRIAGDGSSGPSDAYWDFRRMQNWPHALRSWAVNWRVPFCFRGPGNVKYMYATQIFSPATLVKVEGDTLKPVNYLRNRNAAVPQEGGLELWTDRDGDGQAGTGEIEILRTLAGQPLKADWTHGASTVTPDGTLYLVGNDNAAYRIPLKQQLPSGALVWDWSKARRVAEKIVPFVKSKLSYSARETIMGIDVDSTGNMFFAFSTNLPYANPEWARKLKFGLGHTGTFNAVKVTAFSPEGRRLFLAGRKATGVLNPGEMYHHWAQGGIVADEYFSVSSEWTPLTLYTRDGFFVQSLLADPNRGETPSPYSLGGGETFSGRMVWFPQRKQAYYYTGNTHAMVYRIDGFGPDGKIPGEKRFSGTMTLTRNVDPFAATERAPEPKLLPLTDPLRSGNWGDAAVTLRDNSGNPLAKVDLGYDAKNLYARFRVTSDRAFVNAADDPAMVFKSGDSVGLYLGNAAKHETPAPDDVRILATLFKGKPVVIGMFAQSARKRPFEYYTPAGGRWKFDFVESIPGATVKFAKTADGYVMEFSVPRSELPKFDLKPGAKLGFEAEVLRSGNGVRGLQAISRNHLFTPRSAGQAKMVDDIPSEARLYPKHWGVIEVGGNPAP